MTTAVMPRKTLSLSVILVAVVVAHLASAAAAHDENPTDGSTVWLVPPTHFYPAYIADPRRSQMALMVLSMIESEIPEAGDFRYGIRLGGTPGLVRFHPKEDSSRGLQIDLEAGFYGQFDLESSLDIIGWDGLYGLFASYRQRPELAFRVGARHDSAHIGDEYIEKTGRERIRYTREELIAGVSWTPVPQWRMYGEIGWAYTLRNEQQRGRFQAGLEFLGQRRFWSDRFSWYGAVDVNFFEERDWSPATAVQIGLRLPAGRGNTLFRFAVEFYHGRSLMGEFSFSDETYVSIGAYCDF